MFGPMRTFGVILWKNLLLRKRHYIHTSLEVLLPTLLSVLLVTISTATVKSWDTFGNLTSSVPGFQPPQSFAERPYFFDVCQIFSDLPGINGSVSPFDRDDTPEPPVNFTFYYTNVPLPPGSDRSKVGSPSRLVRDLMQKVEDAVNTLLSLCPTVDDNVEFVVREATNEQEILDISQVAQLGMFTTESKVGAENFLGGAIFDPGFEYLEDGDGPHGPHPAKLDYALRFGFFYTEKDTGRLFSKKSGPGNSGRMYTHFVAFQTMIDLAFIEMKTNTTMLPTSLAAALSMKWVTGSHQMPYPEYEDNNTAFFIGSMLPMVITISFSVVVPALIKRVVMEKESGIRELLKIMGLPSWMNYLCWFIDALYATAITVGIITVVLGTQWSSAVPSVVPRSNDFLFFLYFLLYGFALISSLLALSAPFKNPNLAMTTGIVVHLVTYFAPLSTINTNRYDVLSSSTKIAMACVPNVSLSIFTKLLSTFETGGGIQWSTLWTPMEPGDVITAGLLMVLLLLQSVVYFMIMLYIDTVRPGEYGIARKWYFPVEFMLHKMAKDKEKAVPLVKSVVGSQKELRALGQENSLFESWPIGTATVEATHLRKVFRSFGEESVTAVEDVSFKAFKGQVMALLGHNGAGKSTTFSIIVGMYSKTSGEALINGMNIDEDLDIIRKQLGICPQHNLLFPDLSVLEHLEIFGMLKGLSFKEAKAEGKKYIGELRLSKKVNVVASKLSGGMKRKLNLAIALIGGSSVLMLDEPTSGMDPEARRSTWDILQKEKRDRTVILTTHFMEEADVLGDRIAIMVKGRVKCYGTSMFLKNNWGGGYSLNMTRGFKCNPQLCLNEVQAIVRGAVLKSQAEGELIFSLPADEKDQFGRLFKHLEDNKENMDVSSLGLSVTTLEDVFLRVGDDKGSRDEMAFENGGLEDESKLMPGVTLQNSKNRHQDMEIAKESPGFGLLKLKGMQLLKQRLSGLFTKRVITTWRKKYIWLTAVATPAILAILCQLIIRLYANFTFVFPPRAMTLDDYENPLVTLSLDSRQEAFVDIGDRYLDLVARSASVERLEFGLNQTEWFLEKGRSDMESFRRKLPVGASFLNSFDSDIEIPKGLQFSSFSKMKMPNFSYLSGWYNSVPKHSRPLSVNLVSNALLRHLSGPGEGQKAASIGVTSHPLPLVFTTPTDLAVKGLVSPFIFTYGSLITMGVCMTATAFTMVPISERASGAKQVQMLTGLGALPYWATHYAWDMLMYVVASVLTMIMLIVFDYQEIFLTQEGPIGLLLLLVLHGTCAILVSYCVSFFCQSPASGFSSSSMVNVVTGLVIPTAVWICMGYGETLFKSPLAVDIGSIIRDCFVAFPGFNFARGIMALVQVQLENNACSTGLDRKTLNSLCAMIRDKPLSLLNEQIRNYAECCDVSLVDEENAICGKNLFPPQPWFNVTAIPCHKTKSLFTWDALKGINYDLVALVLDVLFWALVLWVLEVKLVERLRDRFLHLWHARDAKVMTDDAVDVDDDVKAEQRRVVLGRSEEDILMVMGLKKEFGKFKAVQGLSFGVHPGECFGLLGVNGAGKTTTFRMLTGDTQATSGDAVLNGFRLSADPRRFLSEIGYCPQFDAIIETMTGREMMVLMAKLRGIPGSQLEPEINRWLCLVGLTRYADRRCGTYSGGNKRKLSVAMSLIGDPPVIFLDEPSTGVDPVSRRNLWDIISQIRRRGQTIVLTSHSMEECDALCNRLVIMVDGQFQCIGTSQHIKDKYGQGYTIVVKLRKSATQDLSESDFVSVSGRVKEHLLGRLSDPVITEEHREFIHIHERDINLPWSSLFSALEETCALVTPLVEDYSVTQTSLEQVFISFAKKAKNPSVS